MPVMSPNAVSLSHDGDVWRATLGDHAANSLDPFEAIVLVAGKAREAGHKFDFAPMPGPAVAPVDPKPQAVKPEPAKDEPAKPATP